MKIIHCEVCSKISKISKIEARIRLVGKNPAPKSSASLQLIRETLDSTRTWNIYFSFERKMNGRIPYAYSYISAHMYCTFAMSCLWQTANFSRAKNNQKNFMQNYIEKYTKKMSDDRDRNYSLFFFFVRVCFSSQIFRFVWWLSLMHAHRCLNHRVFWQRVPVYLCYFSRCFTLNSNETQNMDKYFIL